MSTASRSVVRDELLAASDPQMRARRRVAALAGALAAQFGIIGMRQYGWIRHLPDPPIPGFDSDAVVTSPAAYPFGIPDSAFAVAACGALVALATAGGTASSGRSVWFDRLLGLGAIGGACAATGYLAAMIRQRRVCAYCLVGTAGFFGIAAITVASLLSGARHGTHVARS